MNQSKGKASPKTSKPRQNNRADASQSRAPRRGNNRNNVKQSGSGPMTGAATAYSSSFQVGAPLIQRSGNDFCKITHKEFIGNVTGSTAFAVGNTFSLNPGLPATCKWLANQARGWEQYEFTSVTLLAKTRTTTAVPGSLYLAPDYDAADGPPVNEDVISTYHGAIEDSPWKEIVMRLDPRMLKGRRFIRTGALPANQDIKTYDVANLYTGTVDGTAVAWSKLILEYTVIFYNQQTPPGGFDSYGTITAAGGTIAAATPFGAVPVVTGAYNASGAGTNALTLTGLSIGVEYSFNFNCIGTVITAISATATSGVTQKSLLFNSFTAGATNGSMTYTYTATATTAVITVNLTATTITSSQTVVTALTSAPSF
jgi:hypothetical protein